MTAFFTFFIECWSISMDWLHYITSWRKSHIGSWLIKMAKPTSVFILTGTGNPELDTEYDSIFLSDPSRRVNFLHAVRSLHPRLLTKLEPTLHFISPYTTPVVITFFVYIILGCNILIWQRIATFLIIMSIHINSSNWGITSVSA